MKQNRRNFNETWLDFGIIVNGKDKNTCDLMIGPQHDNRCQPCGTFFSNSIMVCFISDVLQEFMEKFCLTIFPNLTKYSFWFMFANTNTCTSCCSSHESYALHAMNCDKRHSKVNLFVHDDIGGIKNANKYFYVPANTLNCLNN